MHKLKVILVSVGTLIFVNCASDDERGGLSCFNCVLNGVENKFCRVGNQNYTVQVVGGPTQEYSLEEDQTWEEFKDDMIYFYCEE